MACANLPHPRLHDKDFVLHTPAAERLRDAASAHEKTSACAVWCAFENPQLNRGCRTLGLWIPLQGGLACTERVVRLPYEFLSVRQKYATMANTAEVIEVYTERERSSSRFAACGVARTRRHAIATPQAAYLPYKWTMLAACSRSASQLATSAISFKKFSFCRRSAFTSLVTSVST